MVLYELYFVFLIITLSSAENDNTILESVKDIPEGYIISILNNIPQEDFSTESEESNEHYNSGEIKDLLTLLIQKYQEYEKEKEYNDPTRSFVRLEYPVRYFYISNPQVLEDFKRKLISPKDNIFDKLVKNIKRRNFIIQKVDKYNMDDDKYDRFKEDTSNNKDLKTLSINFPNKRRNRKSFELDDDELNNKPSTSKINDYGITKKFKWDVSDEVVEKKEDWVSSKSYPKPKPIEKSTTQKRVSKSKDKSNLDRNDGWGRYDKWEKFTFSSKYNNIRSKKTTPYYDWDKKQKKTTRDIWTTNTWTFQTTKRSKPKKSDYFGGSYGSHRESPRHRDTYKDSYNNRPRGVAAYGRTPAPMIGKRNVYEESD